MTRPVDIYVRISRVGGRVHLISHIEQEREARAFAAARGLNVGEVLSDIDESGGRHDRPGLLRAVERIESGESSGLIVSLLDRFSRDLKHAPGMVERILAAGGSLLRSRVYLGELRSKPYVNVAAHEPLVDLAAWTAAQRKPSVVRARSDYLLSGLVRCASCGYMTQGTIDRHGTRRYRCQRRHAGGFCPNPARVHASILEPVAVDAFWRLVGDMRAASVRPGSDGVAVAEAALDDAQATLAAWTTVEMERAVGDAALYARGIEERRSLRDAAAEELFDARAASSTPVPLEVVALSDDWPRRTLREQRDMLAAIISFIGLRSLPDGEKVAVIYPAGVALPALPVHGHTARPVLRPFPDELPAGAWTVTLERTNPNRR